jgi:hypothetical protein
LEQEHAMTMMKRVIDLVVQFVSFIANGCLVRWAKFKCRAIVGFLSKEA